MPNAYTDTNITVYRGNYVGYYNIDGSDIDYYLQGSCPGEQSLTFVTQWAQLPAMSQAAWLNLEPSDKLKAMNLTTRYCRPRFYMKDARATVSASRGVILDVTDVGEAREIPVSVFNATQWYIAMSEGQQSQSLRTNFPTNKWPDPSSHLSRYPVSMLDVHRMVPFAIGANLLPMNEYLIPGQLDASYQAAYRILFARTMSDVLSTTLDMQTSGPGHRTITTGAIVMIPAYTYATEAMLVVLAIVALTLFILNRRRTLHLNADPSRIDTLMDMVSRDERLLASMTPSNRLDERSLSNIVGKMIFKSDLGTGGLASLTLTSHSQTAAVDDKSHSVLANLSGGIRPVVIAGASGFLLGSFQLLICIVLAILFVMVNQQKGTPLMMRFLV